jgi:hypothetical protein
VRQRSTPRSTKFWILGLIRTLRPALPLCRKGLLAPGLVCLDFFRRLTQFYLFIMLTALHRVSGAPVENCGMPVCPRIR